MENDPYMTAAFGAELLLLFLAAFGELIRRRLPLAEAAAYGWIISLMFAAFFAEISFLGPVLQNPWLSLLFRIAEIGGWIGAGVLILFRLRKTLDGAVWTILRFLREHRFAWLMGIGWLVLGKYAFEASPGAIIGFAAYLSIGFATYALSRRYAWPPTALTVAMIILTLPRLVLQTPTPGGEVVSAAAALFCLLAIYRSVEEPRILDLALLFVGIPFSIRGNPSGGIFPLILVLLSGVLLYRRHGGALWKLMVIDNWPILLAASIPAIIFWRTWHLFSAKIVQHSDGLAGAGANLLRYLFQSAHFTLPMDRLFEWMFDFRITGFLNGLYKKTVSPLLGGAGAAVPFDLVWFPAADTTWFGPFGFLLILPALLFGLFRGHRRLKAIAVALAGYVWIIGLTASWERTNGAFFTIFFVCAGVEAAFLLPPWRLTRRGRRWIQALCLLLFFYSLFSLWSKPVTELLPLS